MCEINIANRANRQKFGQKSLDLVFLSDRIGETLYSVQNTHRIQCRIHTMIQYRVMCGMSMLRQAAIVCSTY